jgi:protein transport protein SEC24
MQEYMLRPPQPAIYLFLLDVSRQALGKPSQIYLMLVTLLPIPGYLCLECGYLRNFCEILIDELDKLPGDARTQVRGYAFASRPKYGQYLVIFVVPYSCRIDCVSY